MSGIFREQGFQVPSEDQRDFPHQPFFLTRSLGRLKDEQDAVLRFMDYNFRLIHLTLRLTPAKKAGIADRVQTLEEMVSLLDAKPARAAA